MISRRKFLQQNITLAAGACLAPALKLVAEDIIMTVNGPVGPSALGFTLVHEHIMVDFIGAEKTGKHRYKADEVYKRALPFLQDIQKRGCKTFVDCTPAYVGRDAQILHRLATATGLNIITTTGYYGAGNEKFLPKHVFTESAEQIAARWIAEWKNGIDGIKPGFIKCGVDNGPLTPAQRKIIEAAAITHLETGLTIGVHTGNGKAAMEEMDILQSKGVSPKAWIWIHAQNESDHSLHMESVKKGAWLSFDGVNAVAIDKYVAIVKQMKKAGSLQQVLVSQDSGWYRIGEPNGGEFNNYNCIFEKFLPALKENGITQEEIDLLFITNPANALAVRVRKV
jgi:phosphotriesterase-related protein